MRLTIIALALLASMSCGGTPEPSNTGTDTPRAATAAMSGTLKQPASEVKSVRYTPPSPPAVILFPPRVKTVDATLWFRQTRDAPRCYFYFDLPSGGTLSVDLQMSLCEREFGNTTISDSK